MNQLVSLFLFLLFAIGLATFLPLRAQEIKTFTSLKEALKNPLRVKRLTLQGKKLRKFPKKIIQCKNLEELNLNNNQIDSIPREIGKLLNLKKLHVSKNRLVYVSFEINLLSFLIF